MSGGVTTPREACALKKLGADGGCVECVLGMGVSHDLQFSQTCWPTTAGFNERVSQNSGWGISHAFSSLLQHQESLRDSYSILSTLPAFSKICQRFKDFDSMWSGIIYNWLIIVYFAKSQMYGGNLGAV